VEALMTELLGDDLQVRVRHGRLRLGDSWVRFPLRPTDLVRSLPPSFAAKAMRDTVWGPFRSRLARRRRTSSDDTFASVVRDGLGPAMLESFYGPYAEKLWGRHADDIAGDVARRRIAAASPGKLLAKVARAARREPIVFRYPRLGYGQVVDRLVERCHDAGVRLHTDTRVEAIDVGADRPVVTFASPDGVGETTFDRVFWTAPVRPLSDVVVSPPSAAPSVEVEHRAMVLVYLVFEGDPVTEFDAHYLPGPDEFATRVSEPRNYRDGPDPDDVTVLCAEVPCIVGDDVWNAEADSLAEQVLDDLQRLGVTDRRHVSAEVARLPHVYPIIGPDDVEALDTAQRWAHDLPGVSVFGRQGLTVADNLHHVMDMGLAAASRLGEDGTWDDAAWRGDLQLFATHVVED
ncbi:MAG: FAD-dependent oxidoreductase, partial [Actinomycetota bacterium]